MHGNVAEWVLDAYDAKHYEKFAGKKVNWKDVINWPKDRYPRVIRGGGWDSDGEQCRSAARQFSTKNFNKRDPQIPRSAWWISEGFWIGFRVVRPLKAPPAAEMAKYWEPDTEDILDALDAKQDREVVVLVEPVQAACDENKAETAAK